jgi:hypothetical protein
MKEVPLTKGKIAIIDDEDYERVVQHRWFASLINGHWYAYHDFRQKNGKYKHVSMHGFILAAPRGTHIDHINNDGLDNRKSNLRLATPAQNARNCAKYRNNSSGFKGVFRRKSTGRYEAQIKDKGKIIRLGVYRNAEDAARAYDAKALELAGQFARLNFPT